MAYNFDIEELRFLYEKQHLSTIKIAKIYGCYSMTIWRHLNKHNIKMSCSELMKRHVRTKEHCQNISNALKGRKIPQEIIDKQRQGMLRAVARGHSGCFPKGHKTCITPERNAKISIAKTGVKRPDMVGSKNPSWRGGTTSEYSRYLGNDVWNKIRRRIVKRDKNTCQICGIKNVRLDVHHIIPFAVSKDDSDENLITLCQSCHMKEEWIARRKHPMEEVRAC